MQKIRIGTRSSKLALIQAEMVKNSLLTAWSNRELDIELVPITTTGDKRLDIKLSDAGGKWLFTKEIEDALLKGDIDIAVHSCKDMPVILPKGLGICAVLKREDPRDVLLVNSKGSLHELPNKATIGTASSRRKALLLNFRKDFNIINFRGNVQTRIEKLNQKMVDATILALAGLKRLNIDPNIYHIIPSEIMLPAVAQGIICVESKITNSKINELIYKINHYETELCMKVERTFLEKLGGDCSTPIAGLAEFNKQGNLVFQGMVASTDGQKLYKISEEATKDDMLLLGINVAEKLLQQTKGAKLF
ncbi:Porphobilinogen deaminase [Rickettsiales bacterium Ac37b]|nr:Porphobilinogen deaminase [Rickettsiales bacterium Ac37b]